MQTTNLVRKQPLTHRETLTILERLYDLVLQVEQLRRDHSSTDDEQQTVEWQRYYNALVDQTWDTLGVMVPLETRCRHNLLSVRLSAYIPQCPPSIHLFAHPRQG